MDQEVNGTAHYSVHPSILQPGGRGSQRRSAALQESARTRDEKLYFPGHAKSLSGIAARAFLLGLVLSFSLVLVVLLLLNGSLLWRLPSFFAALSVFHFLEFWTTARYNTESAQVSSFLLSQNGSAYNIAHTAAVLEFLSRNFLFPSKSLIPSYATMLMVLVGLVMIAVGQLVRSAAMIQAGTNFSHIVQDKKTEDHQLVTSGIYHHLRHPSYFGFFWWGLGTQLVLGNVLCFTGYTVVLWRFFSRRISG
jgi:protein-S-isoprenylcysteine O-methyltransferase